MSFSLQLVLLLASVGAACAVPGVFLVLRRVALVADAISHVLLFGIAATYVIVRDVSSPWLFVGAVASGVLTVALVELLQRTRLVKEDAAIGLVFPALFALGAILLSMYVTRGTHLDVDQVLLGNEIFSVKDDRLTLVGLDLPRGVWVLGGLFVLNSLLVLLAYKELKLSTFDPELATVFGFAPAVLHYALMTSVSVTAVAAFNAVGPVVVVALFVVPAATAYLLTDRLSIMLVLSVLFAVAGAVVGTLLAVALDTNPAGTVATVLGLIFGVVFLVAPKRGLIAKWLLRWQQKRRFLETMLTIHLLQHEGTPQEADESDVTGLHRHLHWLPTEVRRVVNRAEKRGLVTENEGRLRLTESGRVVAKQAW